MSGGWQRIKAGLPWQSSDTVTKSHKDFKNDPQQQRIFKKGMKAFKKIQAYSTSNQCK